MSINEKATPFLLNGGDHAILFVHGFTGSVANMRPLAELMHLKGYTVQGISLKGHSETIEAMQKATWKEWLLQVEQAYKKLKSSHTHVSVAGLSMGGLLSLILSSNYDVSSCVSLSTPMKTKNVLSRYGFLISPFYPINNKGVDPVRKTLIQEYDIGYNQIPTAKLYDLHILMKLARKSLPKIKCPVLAVQSKKDNTVSADSLHIIMHNINSIQKEELWLEDSPHVCTLSTEMHVIAEKMDGFFRISVGK